MINQAIEISGLANHLLCPMQCQMNGVQNNTVLKLLAGSPSEAAHALQL